MGAALDIYCDAFIALHGHRWDGRPAVLSAPGVRGLVSGEGEQTVRLLVSDDRAYDRVAREIESTRRGVASIFERAPRCEELLRARPGWEADHPTTAMALRDVRDPGDAALPGDLELRLVKRNATDPEGGVPLGDAAAVAIGADRGITQEPHRFEEYLRGLPGSVRLYCAVDRDGVARATSGCEVAGEVVRVFFVNTDRAWRRRGIGRAMTVAALKAAASLGACRAVLDASDVGASVYARIGFEAAGRLTRYSRAA